MHELAQENLAKFVAFGKSVYAGLQRRMAELGKAMLFAWADDAWDVTEFAVYRAASGRRGYLAFKLWTGKTVADGKAAIPQPYADFMKAAVLIHRHESPVEYSAWRGIVTAYRLVFKELEKAGTADPSRLLPMHFRKAVDGYAEGRSPVSTFAIANRITQMADMLDRWRLTPLLLDYHHHISHPGIRVKDRRPGAYQMKMLAQCINSPIDDDERILTEIIRIHFAWGGRVGETLTLPKDCLVKKPRPGAPGEFNYGIRYFPEKRYDGKIKPLDERAYRVVESAVHTLQTLCEPARARAAELEANPGRVPIPGYLSLDQEIELEDLATMLGVGQNMTYAERRTSIKKSWGLQPCRTDAGLLKRFSEGRFLSYYSVRDVEQALLTTPPDLYPIRRPDMTPVLRLSQCLCVKFERQFANRCDPIELLPALVVETEIGNALGARPQARSFFDRRGITMPDGSRIRIQSHSSRHLRNTFLQEAGLSNVQQALAMGRKDLAQTAHYQHGDPEMAIGSASQTFADYASQEENIAAFHQGIRDGRYQGALADQYRRIRNASVERADDFLRLHAGHVLFTRYGACTNNWHRDPCPKHNKCFDGCRHLQVTGGEGELAALKEELELQLSHRQAVLENVQAGEYRADTALAYLERKIEGIRAAIDRWHEASNARTLNRIPIVTMPVFPDGIDRSKPIA